MDAKLSFKKLKELVSMRDNGFFSAGTSMNKSDVEVSAILKSVVTKINELFNVNVETSTQMLEKVTGHNQLIHGIVFLTGGFDSLTVLYIVEIKTAIVSLYHKEHLETWRIALSDKPFVSH